MLFRDSYSQALFFRSRVLYAKRWQEVPDPCLEVALLCPATSIKSTGEDQVL